MSFSKDLGAVSAKYESGGKGVDFVSNGNDWGDPGGDSYGIHQLSGAYSMGAFLRSKYGKPYAHHFKGHKPATDSFNTIYKKVARSDMEAFGYAQKNFYASTHYVPLRDYARKKGFSVTDRGVQEALFSMSVQHGGAKKIVAAVAADGVPASSSAQVKALFKERGSYVMSLRSLSSRIKKNIVNNRYKNEVKDALQWVGRKDKDKYESDFLPDVVDTRPAKPKNSWLSLGLNVVTGVSSIFGSGKSKSTPKTHDPEFESEPKKKRSVPWMDTAISLMGTDEVRGRGSNKKIMSWAKRLGGSVKRNYSNDGVPWCGLFTAHCFNNNGIKVTLKNPLGARNWLKFGEKTEPQYGAVMVFWRGKKSGWTGHVAFYVSEDSKYYHVCGGNQSDSVNVRKMAKNRFLGARWPSNYPTLKKEFAGRIVKKFDGKVSTNEA